MQCFAESCHAAPQAQSREEILADQIIALAFRENRIKNRDLWDIAWLVQQGAELPARLIPLKVRDTVEKKAYWGYLIQVIDEQATREIAALK